MNDIREIMSDAKLKTLCYQKAQLIYGKQLPVEVLNRLQYELDIIVKKGGSDYFLFLQELVNTAQKELGVLIGPGHTSIAGSLVAYCFGITKIDPLKYDLLFERFICPNRFAFPEVWIDVDKEGYDSILHWLEKRNVKMPEKNTIVFEGETAKGKGVFTTQLFVINALSEIKTVLSNIKQMQGIDVDINNIPVDDPSTIELFQKGDTNGIFCFDTQGMQVNLRMINPTRFSDLVILYAMYRPGSMDYILEMLDRKNENKKIIYPIPHMEKYLRESYGMVIYQEQMMQLSQLIADFNESESHTFYKAITRCKKNVLSDIKPKFMEGGVRNGYEKETLERIWKEWEDRGPYFFMKAHAVCFTWLAYQMAYLKVHFPKEFGAMRKQVGLGSDIHEYDVVIWEEDLFKDSKSRADSLVRMQLRKERINDKMLAHQEEILPEIIAFNDALTGALREMYDRAHRIWDNIKDDKSLGDEVELTAKCFLSHDYPELHPVQGEDRQELWNALCDTGWNRLYEDGVTFELRLPRNVDDTFEHFIGMDCPPPNWNEGLDQELTKDLHLTSAFHHLFDHTKFAITDFIYIRKFETEIKIEINKTVQHTIQDSR